jgi:hypothetical protein
MNLSFLLAIILDMRWPALRFSLNFSRLWHTSCIACSTPVNDETLAVANAWPVNPLVMCNLWFEIWKTRNVSRWRHDTTMLNWWAFLSLEVAFESPTVVNKHQKAASRVSVKHVIFLCFFFFILYQQMLCSYLETYCLSNVKWKLNLINNLFLKCKILYCGYYYTISFEHSIIKTKPGNGTGFSPDAFAATYQYYSTNTL